MATRFSQMANCKVLEEIGRRCASTSVFRERPPLNWNSRVAAFGTHEQKQKWLPKLVLATVGILRVTEKKRDGRGKRPDAARPTEDGSHFILNGEKRYITNAAIATNSP